MTKRKIMLITVCFAIFAISLLLSRQFFKSAGKRNMDVPAAGSEQIEDSKDTEEMTELEETERTAASEGAAEPEKVENVTIGSEKYRNTGDLSWIVSCIRSRRGIFIIMYIFRILMTEQKNMHYM